MKTGQRMWVEPRLFYQSPALVSGEKTGKGLAKKWLVVRIDNGKVVLEQADNKA